MATVTVPIEPSKVWSRERSLSFFSSHSNTEDTRRSHDNTFDMEDGLYEEDEETSLFGREDQQDSSEEEDKQDNQAAKRAVETIQNSSIQTLNLQYQNSNSIFYTPVSKPTAFQSL
jgi:hypothetical protein